MSPVGFCGSMPISEVIALRRTGMSVKALAVLTGVSAHSVQRCLAKRGVVGARGGDRQTEAWQERHRATLPQEGADHG